jgi:hypothetical protein
MRLVSVGVLSQQEALANADSATNLLWLLGNGLPDKAAETALPLPLPMLQNSHFPHSSSIPDRTAATARRVYANCKRHPDTKKAMPRWPNNVGLRFCATRPTYCRPDVARVPTAGRYIIRS